MRPWSLHYLLCLLALLLVLKVWFYLCGFKLLVCPGCPDLISPVFVSLWSATILLLSLPAIPSLLLSLASPSLDLWFQHLHPHLACTLGNVSTSHMLFLGAHLVFSIGSTQS